MLHTLNFIDTNYSTHYANDSVTIKNTTGRPINIHDVQFQYYTYGSPSSDIPTISIDFTIKTANGTRDITKTVTKGTKGFITIVINEEINTLSKLIITRKMRDDNFMLHTHKNTSDMEFLEVYGELGCIVTAEGASICKGINDLVVPIDIIEESNYTPKPKGMNDRDWYINNSISKLPIMRWIHTSSPSKTIEDIQDRDWYINTDIWDKPIMWWIKQFYDIDTGFNIFVKHLGDIKKVNKVFVYKGGSFQAVKNAYVLKDNTFKKV